MVECERAEYPLYDLADGRVFDLVSGEIREGFQTISTLTPLEARALEILVLHPDQVVVYEDFERHLYPGEQGYEQGLNGSIRYQTVISRLRTKLGTISPELASKIETFPQRGYRWTVNILPPGSSNA